MAKMSLASLVGFQSTPSARRATALKDRIINREQEFQSTPSARRATRLHRRGLLCLLHFNPRPPRGGRPALQVSHNGFTKFQSTPSARRATRMLAQMLDPTIFQSTPSARRATGALHPEKTGEVISIHALREEGDPNRVSSLMRSNAISIHALREEGDRSASKRRQQIPYFNPRPPRGERPWVSTTTPTPPAFQSTPSARRAT